jgi:hypothetical protein
MGHLLLDTNSFVYEGKYYRQVRRGATGSTFTMKFANSYMFDWKQALVLNINIHRMNCIQSMEGAVRKCVSNLPFVPEASTPFL